MSKNQVIDSISTCDVLIPNFGFNTDKEILLKASKLKLVANFGEGYNNIDVEYATLKNIVVTNTPQLVFEPSAELTLGLMGVVARNIVFYNTKLHTTTGLSRKIYDNLCISMYGKTLDILDMGRIDQSVAKESHSC